MCQAAPLRRIEVDNDLLLFEYQPPIPAAGEASGGYMANVKVGTALRTAANATAADGLRGVSPGSQQQWFSRDSTVGAWGGGVWNMVFSGVQVRPAGRVEMVGVTSYACHTWLVGQGSGR